MQVHRGVCTLECAPRYIKRKSNSITQGHMGEDITDKPTLSCTDTQTQKRVFFFFLLEKMKRGEEFPRDVSSSTHRASARVYVRWHEAALSTEHCSLAW